MKETFTYRIMPPPYPRREELYDLAAKVFSHGGYFKFLQYCRRCYFGGSSYDWSVSRVAQREGRIIAHVGVWDYRMRVGSARLRTGGIGAVMTHPDCRRRGVAAAVMRAVMAAMRQAGYQYSMLFGIRDFYHRFGYVQAWPQTRHVADVSALPRQPGRLALVKVPLTEALCGSGAIMRMYNRRNALRTGTAERPIYTRPRSGVHCHALTAPGGTVRGYLVVKKSGEELLVLEAEGPGPGCGAEELLGALRLLARRGKCLRIATDNLSYVHPLCRALRARDCRVEMRHTGSGGPMGAVVNLRGSLEAMAGELTRRLRNSTAKAERVSLLVSGAGEKVALEIADGRVGVAERPRSTANAILAGAAVARLLIGSEEPATLARQSQVRFTGRALELARILFPPQWPMLNALDGF